jgi:soluble lytic murein transglycosylase
MAAVDCLLSRGRRQDAKELLQDAQRRANSADEESAVAIRLKRFEKKLAPEKKRAFYLPAVEKPTGPQSRLYGRLALMQLEWGEDRFAHAAYWADLLLKDNALELFRRDEALWRAGFGHYLAGRFDQAAARLREWLDAFPQHRDRDRAQYWLARALDKLGDRAGAVKAMRQCFDRWQGTYYGLAAEAWLLQWGVSGKGLPLLPFPDAKTAIADAPALKPDWEQAGGGGQELDNGARLAIEAYAANGPADLAPVFRAFKEAYALGETDEAVRRLDFVRERAAASPDGSYFVSVAYALVGEALSSINAAQRAFEQVREGKLADPHALTTKRRFPLLERDLVVNAAKRHDLDPWLVFGVIKQESAFQLRATSSAGARGLMQVMPGTGRIIARKRGLKGYNPAALYSPETSVDYGCWYLADLLAKLDNDVPATLAGYNAGIGRPRQWWPRFGDRLYDELFELIPIDETRGYVAAIERNIEMYRRLYGDRATIEAERPGAVRLVTQPVKSLP